VSAGTTEIRASFDSWIYSWFSGILKTSFF
jgi:hypothetical protein